MSDKTAKKPSPVVQKKDKNVLRGEAPERRNEIAREMFMRSWGGGKHHNPQDYARGKGRNPKHKGQRSDRSWEGMTSPMARFEEGVSADPTVNMTPQQAAEWKKQNAIHRDQFTGGEAMRNPKARFEEGVPADPTANMTPEQAAEWERQNEAHRDEFDKTARVLSKGDSMRRLNELRKKHGGWTKEYYAVALQEVKSGIIAPAAVVGGGYKDARAVALKWLMEQMQSAKTATTHLAAAWGPVLSRTAKGLEDSCWEGYTAVGMKEMGGKQVPNCVPKQASLADLWGNLMIVVADAGSPEADKAGLKKDADPKSHDQNLASTWEKVAGGSGAENAAYLRRSPLKDKILRAVAKHYGVSVSKIEEELTDPDAEALYEYIGNNPALRGQVYREFQR